jgi:hypothetical protein
MKWISQGNRWLSAPYQIHSTIRGYEVWLNTKQKYGVLAREIPSLAKAQEFAEKHRAKDPA